MPYPRPGGISLRVLRIALLSLATLVTFTLPTHAGVNHPPTDPLGYQVHDLVGFLSAAGDAFLEAHRAAVEAVEASLTPPPPPTRQTPTQGVSAPSAPQTTWDTSLEPCGGDLPPCYVKNRESHGDYNARNPSGACGAWQIMPGTWNGYAGYASACDAPPAVQDEKARQLWAGGAGCSHWSAC